MQEGAFFTVQVPRGVYNAALNHFGWIIIS
jgi:hypothetical protein